MKLKDLERKLSKFGWIKIREGGDHTVWGNGKGLTEPVPRHKEINELLAKKILKKADANPGG